MNDEFKQEIEKIMAGEKHLSFSALKSFMQSPKHFFTYKTDKTVTKAMTDGNIFHMACLEPEKFKQSFWVLDDTTKCAEIGGASPRATKLYKEWVSEQVALNTGKEMLSKADYDTYMSMSDYLKECTATKELMEGLTERESEFEFTYDNFLIKGKIDGKGSDYVIDLKKVADASYKKIRWVVEDNMYDMQAGIYTYACNIFTYYLIFIDTSCNVSVVKLSTPTLHNGFGKFTVAIDEFRRCCEEDLFNSSYEFFNGGYIEI